MKKLLFFLGITIAVFFTACSNDEMNDSDVTGLNGKTDVINITRDGVFPDSITKSLIASYPEFYTFDKSNSDLWIHETGNGTRAAGMTISVTGYNYVRDVKNYKIAFPSGLIYDSRVPKTDAVYLACIKQYSKDIRIPKGATLVIPPQNIMGAMKNMGRHPGGKAETLNIIGYDAKYSSTYNGEDIYELITETVEMTHNIEGKEVFRPAVYIPGEVTNPSQFVFIYQYYLIQW